MSTLSEIIKHKIRECDDRKDRINGMIYLREFVKETDRIREEIKDHPAVILARHELEVATGHACEVALGLWRDAVKIACEEIADGRYKPQVNNFPA